MKIESLKKPKSKNPSIVSSSSVGLSTELKCSACDTASWLLRHVSNPSVPGDGPSRTIQDIAELRFLPDTRQDWFLTAGRPGGFSYWMHMHAKQGKEHLYLID